MKFRLLKANEIDVRVGTMSEKGASLLLYKDSRTDMDILDETGARWKREHRSINGKLFCTVSIYDTEIGEWVERQDVGVESNTEATKGEASDSFKRACVNWGIGRELYTAPFIWVSAAKINMTKNKSGKPSTYDKFSVEKIEYDDNNEIAKISIMNNTKKERVYIYTGDK